MDENTIRIIRVTENSHQGATHIARPFHRSQNAHEHEAPTIKC